MRWRSLLAVAVFVGCTPAKSVAKAPAPTSTPAAKAPPPKPAPPPDDPAFGSSEPATLAVSPDFACAIRGDRKVVCWGDNRSGQLGHGDSVRREGAIVVPGIEDVVEVATGKAHACARRKDGTVWCWGEAKDFRLGAELEDGPQRPRRVPDVADAIALSVGDEHSCASLASGKLRCWGSPEDGRLGLDHLDHVTEPANVMLDIERVTDVVATPSATCVRDGAGAVHCWGLGHPHDANQRMTMEGVAEVVSLSRHGSGVCARSKGGGLLCWGTEAEPKPPDEVPDGVETLVGASGFSCASTAEGLSCWGYGGPMGDGYDEEGPRTYPELVGLKEVHAAGEVVCVRAANDDVSCWGDNASGQLGRSPGGRYATPVEVKAAGTATAVHAGRDVTCALGKDHQVRCWGTRAPDAVERLNERAKSVKEVVVSPTHLCALHGAGKVACFAEYGGSHGELGKEGAPPPAKKKPSESAGILGVLQQQRGMWGSVRREFVFQVADLKAATGVAVARGASCALTAAGVWCWGDDLAPRKSSGSFMAPSALPCSSFGGDADGCEKAQKPRLVPNSKGARAIVGGERMFCMIRSDAKVACWTSGTPTVIAGIDDAASLHGGEEMCALDAKGTLRCWRGSDGKATVSKSFPSPLRDYASWDDFACAVDASGRVLCAGSGHEGQLGDGTVTSFADEPREVSSISTATAVSVGRDHACALLTSGEVMCWGSGDENMGRPRDVLPKSPKPVRIDLSAGS